MNVRSYVGMICGASLISALALYVATPGIPASGVATLVTLGCLALTAELLAFVLPRGAKGSVAFIPYMATVLLVPSFGALLTITLVKAIAELAGRRELQRQLFNIAQLAFTFTATILIYRALGGVSMLDVQGASIREITFRLGPAAFIAFISSFVLNSLVVSRVIALSTGGSTLQVWRDVHLSTIGLDILASPLVFLFAWIYSEWGPILAATFWMPILGVRQLHTTNLELEQTNRELLELMIKSIEARDPYTSGHSRRVKEYAIQIARLMGYDAATVEKIGTAALLHDVGKIYDKYAPILAKEARLSPEEWAVIKEHPVDGANLIATMTRLRELVPAVLHHHENWDGTGYPAGLKSTEIPLASRVIMFADTFDAMTTKRPYRGPLDEAAVRAELVRCRGKQFDPEITDRLLTSDFWISLFPPKGRRTPTPRMLSLIGDSRRIATRTRA